MLKCNLNLGSMLLYDGVETSCFIENIQKKRANSH